MNNKSGSERGLTHPHGACDECDFPYSYDPTDGGTVCVRCLKEKRDHLQKLVEEQKGERNEANHAYQAQSQRLHDLESQLAEQKAENERLGRLLELTKNKWNEDMVKEGRVAVLMTQLAEQTERVKELESKIESMEYDAKEELPE